MLLTLVGKDPDSNPTGSPTVYRTDRGSWIVQGWVVTDLEVLAEMAIPDGETAVEIPDRMLPFFQQEHRRAGRPGLAAGLVRRAACTHQTRQVGSPGADRVRAAQRLPAMVLQHRPSDG
jgi:hypothetical protein